MNASLSKAQETKFSSLLRREKLTGREISAGAVL